MKVYVNDVDKKRKLIDAELVTDRKTTILVKLVDGNLITRKKKRDLIQEVTNEKKNG
jgi:hypothetical protein